MNKKCQWRGGLHNKLVEQPRTGSVPRMYSVHCTVGQVRSKHNTNKCLKTCRSIQPVGRYCNCALFTVFVSDNTFLRHQNHFHIASA